MVKTACKTGGGGTALRCWDWALSFQYKLYFYRSTVETPMSPTSFGEPISKKPRLGIGSGKSLLDIWTARIEKENAKKHVPFAGERSLGEKAKLYLSLERKEAEGTTDRPGNSVAET